MRQFIHMVVASFVMLITIPPLHARTFHAVIFCDTKDKSIGENMVIDLNNVTNFIGICQNLLEDDYDFEIARFDGQTCTRDNVKGFIDKMDVRDDDVVLTFYGGHGTHAVGDNDPWPQYCMNTPIVSPTAQRNWITMSEMKKWLDIKNPRLKIILSNCCNNEIDGVTVKPMWASEGRATPMTNYNADNIRKLFSASGTVMMTGCVLGEFSWCNRLVGGIFTNQLMGAIEKAAQGAMEPDWEIITETAQKLTGNIPIVDQEGTTHYQHPHRLVSITRMNDSTRRDPDPTPKNDSNLSDCLKTLLAITDHNVRLSMIPSIKSKYFKQGAKVITIANDMQTAVDYEDVDDFLRRLALSPYIKGITVLNDNPMLIKVHELR